MKTLRSLIPLAALLFLALLPATAHAATTRYAKPTPTGTGDCLSWTNACTLQTALNSSVSGDEIWVMQGAHKPTTVTTDRSATFALKNGVAIYGGFAGGESSFGDRNITANVTILSGDIDSNDSQTPIITNLNTVTGNTTNSYHVVSADNTVTASAFLDGLTVTAGYAHGADAAGYGGGMYNSGSPTLTNVAFKGNTAGNAGGVYNLGSSPTLTNVSFTGNYASWNGGGFYNQGGTPTLTNASFISNTVGAGGGGLFSAGAGSLTLTTATFSSNSASGGGGMYTAGSNPTVTNVSFSGNSASNGGGMYSADGSPTVTNVSFSSNSAGDGGGMYTEGSSPTVTNVTFSGNTASSSGGGVFKSGGTPTFANVTFSGNTATSFGGGMYDTSGNMTMTNVTFKGNSANRGGGIYNWLSPDSIRNAIFWGNTASSFSQISPDTYPILYDSVVQGGYTNGINIIMQDPLLGTLGDYGGSTPTIPLLPGSSALDAGNDAVCAAAPVNNLDQRGVARDMYGDHCDIGAYESRGFAFVKTAGDNQSTLINTVYPASLGISVSSPDGVPVDGGSLFFVGPSFGASTNPAISTAPIAGGAASKSLTANGTLGSYAVKVAASDASPGVTFSLTNTVSTLLTSSANPSVSGQAVTLTATVSGTSPTGTITFKETSANIVGCVGIPLTGGSAACAVPSLAVGVHTFTAEYSGDAQNSPSPSPTFIQIVNTANTTVDLTSSLNPSAYADSVTFTAAVAAASPGMGTPSGMVQFQADGINLGVPVSLSGGSASLSTAGLGGGTHVITADYGGSSDFNASTGTLAPDQIVVGNSTVSLTASANPSTFGQTVTITATVSGVSPTGIVSFADDGTPVGGCQSAALASGQATCTMTPLSVGTHTITAAYGGDATNAASSQTLAQVVTRANTTTAITSSPNPSIAGDSVLFTVTVSAVVPGSGTPTGTVELYETTSPSGASRAARRALAAQSLVNGVATFSVSSFAAGTHNMLALYSGDAQNNASTSSTYAQVVNRLKLFFPVVGR